MRGIRLEKKAVTVKFGGEFDGVSVETFTQVVVNYARTLQAAAAETHPEIQLDVMITATRPGCLEAILQACSSSLPGILATLTQSVGPISDVIDLVNGYLELRRFLGENGAPSSIQESGGNITVIAGKGSSITVNKNVYKISTAGPVASAAESMFSALESDSEISSISLSAEDSKPFTTLSDTFQAIRNAPPCKVSAERIKNKPNEILAVSKPVLEVSDKHKWGFIWNGEKLSGYLADFDFLEKLRAHDCTFGIGDSIVADLELTQRQNAMQIWENWKVRVVKVHRVIPHPVDQTLFDGDDDE